MEVKNEEHVKELRALQEQLKKYEVDVKLGSKEPDLIEYRDLVQRLDELKYFDVARKQGADEWVQARLLNLRLEERQGLLGW